MRRIAIASMTGTVIEFYDFFIYGTAAALVFPTVFFPDLSPIMATTASLGAFAAAFLARPVGAAVFGALTCERLIEGHLGGDRAIAGGLGKSGDATSAEPSALAEPDADVRSGTSRAPSRRKLERSDA